MLRYLSNLNVLALVVDSHFVNWIQRIRFNLSQLRYLLSLGTLGAHGGFLVVADTVVVLYHCSLNVLTGNVVPDALILVLVNEFGSLNISYFHIIPNEPIWRLRPEML